MDIDKELQSEEYQAAWARHQMINRSVIACLSFCVMNFGRDIQHSQNSLYLRMVDDIFQSVISIEVLAKEGVRNTCLRELRYLLEVSIKSCFIAQKYSGKSVEEQIEEYEKLLMSPNINLINQIKLYFLGEEEEHISKAISDFRSETKRLYGVLSSYVHFTPHQIHERIQGRGIGFEGVDILSCLNSTLESSYSVILTLFFHSIPEWVVGDFLVWENGINPWYFSKSRFVAKIDEHYDYKNERQIMLEEIIMRRQETIAF